MSILNKIYIILLIVGLLSIAGCGMNQTTIPSQEDLTKLKPGEVVEHVPTSTNPYYFYTYFPQSALEKRDITLLVWGHGSGDKDWEGSMDSYKEGASKTLKNLKYYFEKYKLPGLIVAVPNSFGVESHKLTQQTFTTTNELFRRPDLKVVDAIWNQYIPFLRSLGFNVDENIYMMGFSGPGIFSYRFSIIHPEHIRAVWMGGGTVFPLVVNSCEGTTIDWPVGINNFKQLTGEDFDFEAFKKIYFYVERGELDTNSVNTLGYLTQDQLDFINKYFGKTENEIDKNATNCLKTLGINISYHEYPGLIHEVSSQMWEDAFAFLTNH